MKHILILLTSTFLINVGSMAQTSEDSVKAVINRLFDGMKNADTGSLKNVFGDSAILQTIRKNTDGSYFVQNDNVKKFIESIGSAKKDSLDERIFFESVKIDGPLASVWTPYKFYYAGKLSHCGVNSFQLVRIKGNWKIQYLVDTRRKQGCE